MWNISYIFIDGGSLILYATGETCFTISKGPYHFGASFFDLTFVLRLCASSHTLSPVTNDLGVMNGLMHLFNVFCASVRALASSNNLCCALGLESSRMFRLAVGLIPKMS